ncbi:MAG TPA: APC family permease [Rhizomicrobium sp.]|nr:APC family permease [Rhizomicrobium sp.]
MSAAPQKLRFIDTALYGLALGTGMRWIAVAAAVGPSSLPLWLFAFLVFYAPLAAATAELTWRFPGEGGIYVWARDTLGPLAGFLCGWFYWIAQLPYFAGILYFLGGLILAAIGGDPRNTLSYMAISVAILGVVTAMQLLGLRYGKWLPNFGTAGGWAVLFVIVGVGVLIALRGENATHFLSARWMPHWGFDTAILWGTIVFAYSGIEAIGFLRNEVEGGMRTILRVLALVGIGCLIIYFAGTIAFLVILPKDALSRLAGFPDALRLGLAHVGAGGLAPLVIGLFALSMLGGFTSWFGVACRLPFAAGIDAFLPPVFARRDAKTGAPVPAILLQASLTLAMILLGQAGASVAAAYDFMVAMGVLTAVVPYIFMFAVYLRTSRMAPVPGAWTPPGGARTSFALGAVGLASTLIAIACTMVPNSGESHPLAAVLKIVASAAAMTAVGLLFYWLGNRRRAVPA